MVLVVVVVVVAIVTASLLREIVLVRQLGLLLLLLHGLRWIWLGRIMWKQYLDSGLLALGALAWLGFLPWEW